MLKEVERIEWRFDLMELGMTADMVKEIIDLKNTYHLDPYELGFASERIIFLILSHLPIVSSVEQTEWRSADDIAGRDMIVEIDKYEMEDWLDCKPAITSVGVQVKSSEEGVKEFLSGFGETASEIRGKLAEEKLVVLNGMDEPRRTIGSFRMQVRSIDDYWQKEGGSVSL